MALIYCVEDDSGIRELVMYALKGQKFDVKGFDRAEKFYKELENKIPDLILLDIMLPGEDGLCVLKKLRKTSEYSTIPIVMMTAKTSEYDIVKGLDSGADDYITKPFGIMELISRVKSLLRRSNYGKNTSKEEPKILKYKNTIIDEAKHVVTENGKEVFLTLKEFKLLRYLVINKGIVLSRDRIMEVVWDSPIEIESRTVDMHIKSLRKKIKDCDKHINTVRGIGYRLEHGKENK